MRYVLTICALLSASCVGIVDGEAPGPKGSVPLDENGNSVGGSGVGGTTGTMSKAVPFSVRVGEPELLPFDVRVRRISNVLKVPVSNPMFGEMLAKNIQLGDYDHAAGALQDNLWLARRLSTWADALTPICGSTEMKALFPALPGNAAQLIKAAWGRTATETELSEIDTAVSEAALLPAESYEATCMAVFTAAEFVFR
jgi:hypothetical protein